LDDGLLRLNYTISSATWHAQIICCKLLDLILLCQQPTSWMLNHS